MAIFSNKGNFSQVCIPTKPNRTLVQDDPTPSIDQLPDGDYLAIRYGYTLELKDGSKYRTRYGVRNTRSNAGQYKYVTVKNGEVETKAIKKFSGYAEMGGVLQGAYYGRKPLPGENITRITLDMKGFKIPEKTAKESKIKSQKAFAMVTHSDEYRGGISTPKVGISADNTIIRRNQGKFATPTQSSQKIDQPNKVNTLTLDWDNNNAFHLGIEPWITSPLMSDTDDGIYIGTVKGEEFTTANGSIMLAIKLSVDYPETVLGLVKGKKIYLFKQSQLVNSIGSKVFSDIKSDEDFRDYAHNLMKSAHKDDYSESKTDKVVDDLLDKHEGKDYGELIGRLKSGLGNKSYSESPENCDYHFDPIPQNMEADPDKKIWYEWDAVIGTMIMSVAYMHLYHLCTGNYGDHKALQEYYQKMPYDIDRLAEAYLADKFSVNFINAIIPTKDVRDYVMELRGYLTRFQSKVDKDSPYASLFDNVINTLVELDYKLKRLSGKSKSFSFISNRYDGKDVDNMVESISDAIKAYIRKYKKSPVKEVTVKDSDKRIKQYVRSKMLNGKDMSDLIDSLMRVLTAPLTIKGGFR